ncbi:MAG: DUF2202 domain-containing protein [Sedimentisphaerales bacterium]|nr:DUF2202 domain-containing protein [Sedimentisphaerales bacterium]
MKLRTLSLVVLILFVGLTSVSTAGMRQQRRAAASFAAVQPTDSEVIDLWYMRQEEKLARDVYLTLSEQWDAVVFANISESEQRHMDSIKRLIDIYNLEDPVDGLAIGEFADQAFVDLYNELTELGAKSLTDAFSVGITIEELDIADLTEKIKQITTRNVKRVFENLLSGSEKHLAAFQYNIDNYDPDSPETCINGGQQRQGRNRPGRDGQGMHAQRRNGQGRNAQGMNGQGRNRQGRNGQGRRGQGRNMQECNCDGTCINQ